MTTTTDTELSSVARAVFMIKMFMTRDRLLDLVVKARFLKTRFSLYVKMVSQNLKNYSFDWPKTLRITLLNTELILVISFWDYLASGQKFYFVDILSSLIPPKVHFFEK